MKPTDTTKKYLLWLDYGCEGWNWQEFDTIKEALEYDKYNEFIITKKVDYDVTEKED